MKNILWVGGKKQSNHLLLWLQCFFMNNVPAKIIFLFWLLIAFILLRIHGNHKSFVYITTLIMINSNFGYSRPISNILYQIK